MVEHCDRLAALDGLEVSAEVGLKIGDPYVGHAPTLVAHAQDVNAAQSTILTSFTQNTSVEFAGIFGPAGRGP